MSEINSEFLKKARSWISDGYKLDVLYASCSKNKINQICSAFIIINPLISHSSTGFVVNPAGFQFGHMKDLNADRSLLLSILDDAIAGKISVADATIELPNYEPKSSHSNINNRGSWFSPLHLKLYGKRDTFHSIRELGQLDDELRIAQIPFDGVNDVLGHLGLPNTIESGDTPYLEIIINPPVDLVLDQTVLSNNLLKVVLHAHEKFNEERVQLTIRTLPGHSLRNRSDATSKIEWSLIKEGRKIGVAEVKLAESDSALTMLSIDNHTVRRHWISDKDKTRNLRLLPILSFDTDLSKTKASIFSDTNSRDFEKGIANLLFIHGFNPCQPVESEAPDLVVITPNGKIIIVECTIKIADFSNKIGKLVDRRGALKKVLSAQETSIDPIAVLICRLPNDQISAKKNEPKDNKVILLSAEHLFDLFNNCHSPYNPDTYIENELNNFS